MRAQPQVFVLVDRSIDMHVSKVRRELGDSDNGSDHIQDGAREWIYLRAFAARQYKKLPKASSRKHEKPVSQIFLFPYWMAAGSLSGFGDYRNSRHAPVAGDSNLQAQEPKFLNEALQAINRGATKGLEIFPERPADKSARPAFHLRRSGPRTVGPQPSLRGSTRARHGPDPTCRHLPRSFRGPVTVLSQNSHR